MSTILSSLGQWVLGAISPPSPGQHGQQGDAQDQIPSPPYLPAERAHQLESFQNLNQDVDATATSSFFQRLPPDIRRLILFETFGDRIFHVDLRLLGDSRSLEAYNHFHGHEPEHYLQYWGQWMPFSSFAALPGVQWRWYGCVCHREPERRVRRHTIMNKSLSPPWFDSCLKIQDTQDMVKSRRVCGEWSGEESLKCRVGAMGWLRTCRQA